MRRANLNELTTTVFDIVVVGGGITGAAIARDASLRGLKVVLADKEDFAAGTSSRSSKLIHGGLRYLETMQFGLVAESVRERELSLKLAPHLSKVQPFLYMLYKDSPEKKLMLKLGLSFYDFVSRSGRDRRHQMLNKQQILERQPQFRSEGLLGAGMFYDVATDDARVTIDTVKSAAEHGAQLINHCEVTGLVFNDNKCNGIRVVDKLTQQEGVIKGSYVVNATGPWSDDILRFENPSSKILKPTKGVHIVLSKRDFPLHSAVFMRSPDDGRVVWPIPSTYDDRVYIGTTDTTFDGDLNNVYPEKDDIQYLLNVANHLMPAAKLTQNHVIGSWAGLRPLIAPKDELNNSKTPREHQVLESKSGVFSIIGGKLTSHRVMAKHLLDELIQKDQHTFLIPGLLPYSADKVTISGARFNPYSEESTTYSRRDVVGLLRDKEIPVNLAEIWASRYGYNALKIANLWLEDALYKVDLAARNLTVAELHYCVKEEAANSISDLLIRRTSCFFWDATGGVDKINDIANEMQNILGWNEEEKFQQVKDYSEWVIKHRPVPLLKSESSVQKIQVVGSN